MARVKLELPSSFLSNIIIPLRITDINYGNHLGNDALVSILHEARVQWLQQQSYTELDIESSSIIMSELIINYLNEAFYGDTLEIKLYLGDVSTVGFELYYQIKTIRQGREIEIAKAKTGLIFYDYTLKKIASFPNAFKQKILAND